MRIVICGAGFVGLTTATQAAADNGHEVVLVEPDRQRRQKIKVGVSPFHEPGIAELLRDQVAAGRIKTVADFHEAPPADLVVVCVGTPARPDGGARMDAIEQVARQIGAAIDDHRGAHARGDGTDTSTTRTGPPYPVVLVKSTVPPGTTRGVFKEQMQALCGRHHLPELAMSPEFLREGDALQDLRAPDRIVIGADSQTAADAVRRFYGPADCPVAYTTVETAEMIKYVTNAFLATKVSFANEVGNLCEATDLDVDEVLQTVALDHRIAGAFLHAGLGFGGSCFPKDLRALQATAHEKGVRLSLVEAALERNGLQPLHAVTLARQAVGDLRDKRVALLGLAFKPETSDVRESAALPIYAALREAGADVVCYDPAAGPAFAACWDDQVTLAGSALEALEDADLAIIQTAWDEFRDLDPDEVQARTSTVIDGRRALDAEAYVLAGCQYVPVGRGTGTLAGEGRRERRMLKEFSPLEIPGDIVTPDEARREPAIQAGRGRAPEQEVPRAPAPAAADPRPARSGGAPGKEPQPARTAGGGRSLEGEPEEDIIEARQEERS